MGNIIEGTTYYFYLTDHLGNNRVVAKADGTVIQKNHYYPFGIAFAENTVTEQGKQPYKYNGKELDQMHGLNMYDYSARYYEPAIGRFSTVDPLAEKYYSISPYVYSANNPIKFVDKDGRMFGPPDKPGLWKSAKAIYAATYTVVRQTIGNTIGISSDASSLRGAVAASLSRYDEVNLKGDLIDKIKGDPAMQTAEQSFIGQLGSNEKLGKEDFNYGGILRVQFRGSRGDGQGSWEVGKTLDVALNSLTWLIRNTDVNASAAVSKDGKVKITYSLSPNEKLDLRPNGSESSYDVITSVLGFLYHDIAGGSDQTKARATWTTETELK